MRWTPEYSPVVGRPTESHTKRYPMRNEASTHKMYPYQVPDTRKGRVDAPPERVPPRDTYFNYSPTRNYRKGSSYPSSKKEPLKWEDEYPLLDFIEPTTPHNNMKIKVDPNWSDSDQDIGSDNETHLYPPAAGS